MHFDGTFNLLGAGAGAFLTSDRVKVPDLSMRR
jgi:hypothetical protein